MIDADITRIAPEQIGEAHVVLTVVGGEIVFQNPATH